jgi:hypothetical protein
MPRSTQSSIASTIRTVDDVFGAIDLNGNQSLEKCRSFIASLDGVNPKVKSDSLRALQSPEQVFCPLTANVGGLLKALHAYGVILGGAQATSFFYPICNPPDSPWDFFYDSRNGDPDGFISLFMQLTMYDTIEDISSDGGHRVVHLRGNGSTMKGPINVRIFVSPYDTISRVLSFKVSHLQSFVSSTMAVCFWPRLTARNTFREFESNNGFDVYPSGKTVCLTKISGLSLVKPRVTMSRPSIYSIEDKRTEFIVFENVLKIPSREFNKSVEQIKQSHYAVYNSSTRYMGSTATMQ